MWRAGNGLPLTKGGSAPGLLAGGVLVLLSLVAVGACDGQKAGPATAGGTLSTDDNRWQIVSVSGDTASWRLGEGPWQVATVGDILLPRSELRLGMGATAVMDSGGDRIVVAENSEIAVPEQPAGSRVKRIMQSLGTMLLRIETREKGGFHVKTPYLVATVKGTQFGVTVNEGGASVSVTEGVVGVDAGDGSPEADVTPGQTASVSSGAGRGVDVKSTPAGSVPSGLIESMDKRAPAAANAPVGPGTNRGRGNTSPGTSQGSGNSSSASSNSNAGGNSGNSNAGGNSGNSNAGGNSGNSNAGGNSGNSGNSNAGGNSGNSNAGGNSGNSNAGGNSDNSNAGGNSGNSNAGGNSGNSNAGGNGGGKGGGKK